MRSSYRVASLVLLLAIAPALSAAPPVDVPAEVKGEPGAFVTVRAKTDGAKVVFVALDPGLNVFPADLLADKKATVVTAAKPGRYRLLAYSAVKDDPTEPATVVVVIGGAPAPPPTPPTPTPVPPAPKPPEPAPPAPEPVSSFRVILVYESGVTMPANTNGVFWGSKMEAALADATAGDAAKFAWRRLDKDADPATLPAGLREVWAAAKPKVTTVPCIVFQVNDQITIEPVPTTAPAAAALIAKYRGK